MKISLDWLSDFIDITEKDQQKIKDIITERSAEVETMEKQGDHLEKVVVGKVTEVKKHPNADSLMLCKVNDGKESVQVVCGGTNVKEGMLCAFAKLGAVVKWHGTNVVKMEKARIRGEESFGMICSGEEIGLADMFPKKSENEIVDLSALSLKVGSPLAEALEMNDVVLDVDNHAITNRADLFSHKGFAREFVANGLGKWRKNHETKLPDCHGVPPIELIIEAKDSCSHYMGIYMTDAEVKDSPEWIKKRLIACGINPISNIVDITNYVMLELGIPLHAFDLDQIKGKKWTMRTGKRGEKMITLDEQSHELNGGELVLDDGNELFDLCGIMGGYNSGINMKTKKIWLHAPVYNPTVIRKGMRGLGHVSDAAIIYEKGVDPALAEYGLARAIELIKDVCPDVNVASEVMDIWNPPRRTVQQEERYLDLTTKQINRLIGIDIPSSDIERILTDLGFGFQKLKDGYKVSIPSWRMNDCNRESDLVEEIARIYGFNNIPSIAPVIPVSPVTENETRFVSRRFKELLTGYGYNELCTFAFLGPDILRKCEMELNGDMIEIANPISSDLSLMRMSLVPWTLEMVSDNLRYQNKFKLFEISKIYKRTSDTEHEETTNLIMASVGENEFKVMQGIIESLDFKVMVLHDVKPAEYQHPGRIGAIVVRGKTIGRIYEVHPKVLKNFDIKERVTLVEIDVSMLVDMNIDHRSKYKEIPKYPSVQLDVSMVIPRKNLAGDYMDTIAKTDKTLIQKVELIDEYAGDQIAEDKRGLTYSITYQSSDRTLTDQEVETIHKQVLERLKKTGVDIR